ncbi:MAG: hypothetical protein JWP38_782 [Herbaspirillum sp.]|nr:hypothetical protein [Herbaspirillum sp.]
MSDLPAELITLIVKHIRDPADINKFSLVNARLFGIVKGECNAKKAILKMGELKTASETVSTLDELNRILGKINSVPKRLSDLASLPLAVLAGGIWWPPEAGRKAFHAILEAIQKHLSSEYSVDPLATLAGQIVMLPESGKPAAFGAMLAVCKTLPDEQRAKLLVVLARQILTLAGAYRQEAFLEVIKTLSAEHCFAPLTELAKLIWTQPEAGKLLAFGAVLEIVKTLPDEQRAAMLVTLAGQIRTLPVEDQQAAFGSLAGQIGMLPKAEREATFDAVWEILKALPDEQRSALLATLRGQTGTPPIWPNHDFRSYRRLRTFPDPRQ